MDALADQLHSIAGTRWQRIVEPIWASLYRFGERRPTLLYSLVALVAQVVAVAPIVIYLMIFRAALLDGKAMSDAATVFGGLLCVVIGLFFFIEGLNFALMPLGEVIGRHLRDRHVSWVLLFVCALGLLVTLCEPAVNSLQTLGSSVDARAAPHLFFLVNTWGSWLLLFVGAGVGAAASLGTLRIRRRWSLKPLVYTFVPLCLALSYIGVFAIPQLASVVEIAWDCGGITTGLVSTAIIISFGIGSGGQQSESTVEGFGIVTLASLLPIIFVLLQSFLMVAIYTDEEIAKVAGEHVLAAAEPPSLANQTPYYEMIIALRSVVPLAFFLWFTLKVLLRKPLPKVLSLLNDVRNVGAAPSFVYEVDPRVQSNDVELRTAVEVEVETENVKLDDDDDDDGGCCDAAAGGGDGAVVALAADDDADEQWRLQPPNAVVAERVSAVPWLTMLLGMLFCLVGAGVFNLGLTYGLAALGEQAGAVLPAAFAETDEVQGSPFYSRANGVVVVAFFSLCLGFFVTIAEPGLQVMGRKIEVVTNGAFRSAYLVTAVALGVACGMATGIMRIVLGLEFIYIITALYSVALLLTAISEEDLVNVAWDSAGVTTGVQTTPFVLALGLHLTKTTQQQNGGAGGGFGVLALASVGPIITVLGFGLGVRLLKAIKARFAKQ
jgi:hypothetical protein